jgi:peptidoglycan/xylan/chitin deacetylase (PgdA/CDA1 family)
MSRETKKLLKKGLPTYKSLSPFFNLITKRQLEIRDFLFNTASIIVYHRVADVMDDPHQLSVSPAIFEEQMEYLKKNFNIIRLSDLAVSIKEKRVDPKSVAITFDDGYFDNLSGALPILEKFQIPATIYIVAGKIDDDKPFYWDEKTSLADQGRPLSKIELKKLATSNLIEIGAHTVFHPQLSSLSREGQAVEIRQSKKMIEDIIGQPIISFSYPFGSKKDFNLDSVELVKEAGFEFACANIQDRVTAHSNNFALPRLLARNNLDDFIKLIQKKR